jgi:hypothetical protein
LTNRIRRIIAHNIGNQPLIQKEKPKISLVNDTYDRYTVLFRQITYAVLAAWQKRWPHNPVNIFRLFHSQFVYCHSWRDSFHKYTSECFLPAPISLIQHVPFKKNLECGQKTSYPFDCCCWRDSLDKVVFIEKRKLLSSEWSDKIKELGYPNEIHVH